MASAAKNAVSCEEKLPWIYSNQAQTDKPMRSTKTPTTAYVATVKSHHLNLGIRNFSPLTIGWAAAGDSGPLVSIGSTSYPR